MQFSQAEVGGNMVIAITVSTRNRVALHDLEVQHVPIVARFGKFVQWTLQELEASPSRGGPTLALLKDIKRLRQIGEQLASCSGPSDDDFHLETRPILVNINKILDKARQHERVAAKLSASLTNLESDPRSNAATASRTSSSLLHDAGVLTAWTAESIIAGAGALSASAGGSYPSELPDLSEYSEDTEDSGFVSQSSNTTPPSDALWKYDGQA